MLVFTLTLALQRVYHSIAVWLYQFRKLFLRNYAYTVCQIELGFG